jgi:hypothetical protein
VRFQPNGLLPTPSRSIAPRYLNRKLKRNATCEVLTCIAEG